MRFAAKFTTIGRLSCGNELYFAAARNVLGQVSGCEVRESSHQDGAELLSELATAKYNKYS